MKQKLAVLLIGTGIVAVAVALVGGIAAVGKLVLLVCLVAAYAALSQIAALLGAATWLSAAVISPAVFLLVFGFVKAFVLSGPMKPVTYMTLTMIEAVGLPLFSVVGALALLKLARATKTVQS
ncbi:UNVERIFIED_ORG: hypothetical protein ABID33_000046 [Xanthobacter viscosus]|uniref:Uncharacterized protein n=1 Tax=Xanthobacter autotrophicus TaxID=280 RepID=A0A6C1KIL3_XANAU|nr:hypothetical protein [Xanthobacter autotrophicus]TLX44040.1 hypothetical protein FBQ73_08135 [Xanthobacter autotrophicus]